MVAPLRARARGGKDVRLRARRRRPLERRRGGDARRLFPARLVTKRGELALGRLAQGRLAPEALTQRARLGFGRARAHVRVGGRVGDDGERGFPARKALSRFLRRRTGTRAGPAPDSRDAPLVLLSRVHARVGDARAVREARVRGVARAPRRGRGAPRRRRPRRPQVHRHETRRGVHGAARRPEPRPGGREAAFPRLGRSPKSRGERRRGRGGGEIPVQPPGMALPQQSQQVGTRFAGVVAEERRSRRRRPRRRGRALAVQRGETGQRERHDRPRLEPARGREREQGVSAERERHQVGARREVLHLGDVDELVTLEVQHAKGAGQKRRGTVQRGDGVVRQVDVRQSRAQRYVPERLARVVRQVQGLQGPLRVQSLNFRDAVVRQREVRESDAPAEPRDGHERVARRVQVGEVHVLRHIQAHQAVPADVQGLQRGQVLQPGELEQRVARQIQRADVPCQMRDAAQVGERPERLE